MNKFDAEVVVAIIGTSIALLVGIFASWIMPTPYAILIAVVIGKLAAYAEKAIIKAAYSSGSSTTTK